MTSGSARGPGRSGSRVQGRRDPVGPALEACRRQPRRHEQCTPAQSASAAISRASPRSPPSGYPTAPIAAQPRDLVGPVVPSELGQDRVGRARPQVGDPAQSVLPGVSPSRGAIAGIASGLPPTVTDSNMPRARRCGSARIAAASGPPGSGRPAPRRRPARPARHRGCTRTVRGSPPQAIVLRDHRLEHVEHRLDDGRRRPPGRRLHRCRGFTAPPARRTRRGARPGCRRARGWRAPAPRPGGDPVIPPPVAPAAGCAHNLCARTARDQGFGM